MDEPKSNVETASLSARVSATGPIGTRFQLERRQKLRRALLGYRGAHAVQPTLEHELGPTGDGRIGAPPLAHVANPLPNALRVPAEIAPGDHRLTVGGWKQGREHAQCRRLSSAVRTKKAKDLPDLDLHIDAFHRVDRPLT
jgi:hypothetical protein